MPQILDHFLEPLYGQVCLSGQGAELPWMEELSGKRVLASESAVTVAVADEEPEGQVEVEVYLGPDETPRLRGLELVFDGTLHLPRPGLLVFAPTGDEVLLPEVKDGSHRLALYCDAYPVSRLVALIDGAGTDHTAG